MTTAIHPDSSLTRRRESLRHEPRCLFIDPDEFRELVIARRQFERADDPASGTLGLRDEATGTTYLVEVERVLSAT